MKNIKSSNYSVYNLLSKLQEQGKYRNLLLSITDDIESVVDYILTFGSAA